MQTLRQDVLLLCGLAIFGLAAAAICAPPLAADGPAASPLPTGGPAATAPPTLALSLRSGALLVTAAAAAPAGQPAGEAVIRLFVANTGPCEETLRLKLQLLADANDMMSRVPMPPTVVATQELELTVSGEARAEREITFSLPAAADAGRRPFGTDYYVQAAPANSDSWTPLCSFKVGGPAASAAAPAATPAAPAAPAASPVAAPAATPTGAAAATPAAAPVTAPAAPRRRHRRAR
jgi:hypothetical protein